MRGKGLGWQAFILLDGIMLVVVKVGGSILASIHPTILEEIRKFSSEKRLVLVHGGGGEVTSIAKRMGKEQVFVVSPEGIKSRYTDKEDAEIYTMVMAGKINKGMVALLVSKGVTAVGLSGVDGGLLRAERKKKLIIVDERGRKRIIEGGYTGKISAVNKEVLFSLLDRGYLPVVSPVALGSEGELLNVDGDRAAAYIAGSLKAESVIFLTDVPGLNIDGEPKARITLSEAEALLPKIGAGMNTKVIASIEALKMGASEAVISSGMVENPIGSAVSHQNCTYVVRRG